MDTDDLTEQAYEVIPRAYQVLDVLCTEIGASAMSYSTEDDFLQGTQKMLKLILKDPKDYLADWNYLDSVDATRFAEGVKGLISHVEKTLNTPRKQRGRTAIE